MLRHPGFFNILQAKDPCKGAKARHSATVLEEREHQADGQNMNPNPAAHILGLRASLALLRWGKFKGGQIRAGAKEL